MGNTTSNASVQEEPSICPIVKVNTPISDIVEYTDSVIAVGYTHYEVDLNRYVSSNFQIPFGHKIEYVRNGEQLHIECPFGCKGCIVKQKLTFKNLFDSKIGYIYKITRDGESVIVLDGGIYALKSLFNNFGVTQTMEIRDYCLNKKENSQSSYVMVITNDESLMVVSESVDGQTSSANYTFPSSFKKVVNGVTNEEKFVSFLAPRLQSIYKLQVYYDVQRDKWIKSDDCFLFRYLTYFCIVLIDIAGEEIIKIIDTKEICIDRCAKQIISNDETFEAPIYMKNMKNILKLLRYNLKTKALEEYRDNIDYFTSTDDIIFYRRDKQILFVGKGFHGEKCLNIVGLNNSYDFKLWSIFPVKFTTFFILVLRARWFTIVGQCYVITYATILVDLQNMQWRELFWSEGPDDKDGQTKIICVSERPNDNSRLNRIVKNIFNDMNISLPEGISILIASWL